MATKKSSKKILYVGDGQLLAWQYPLFPEMLNPGGMFVDSAQPNIVLRLDREYVLGRLRHDLVKCLGIDSLEDAIELVSEALEGA